MRLITRAFRIGSTCSYRISTNTAKSVGTKTTGIRKLQSDLMHAKTGLILAQTELARLRPRKSGFTTSNMIRWHARKRTAKTS